MYQALTWLLVIEILGLLALPLTYTLFRRLPDRGIGLSKVLALLLSSYVLWILGLAHALPNAQHTIIAILAVMAVASCLILWRKLAEILSFMRREWMPLVTAELVFLGLFFLWLSVVSFSAAINHTEKPMDFAFLNSILQSRFFPPEDPWLAGNSISYYYFGHFMTAFMAKLTSIPSSISYNLGVVLIPALVGAGAFSLVYNLIRLSGARMKTAVMFALAAPLFIALIGNLEGVLELVHARGWGSEGFWQSVSIKGLVGLEESADPSMFPRDHWWWFRATRVVDTVVGGVSRDFTITEFPFFSFFLGDLHAHVTALPFMVLSLALGLNLFVCGENLGLGWLRRNAWEVFWLMLSLGALAFINIWDFPVFLAIFAALVLIKGYGDSGGLIRQTLIPSLTLLIPVVLGAVLLFLPFFSGFDSQASGILPVKDVMSTRPLFFFLIWGLFLAVSGPFILKQLVNIPWLGGRNPPLVAAVLVITLLPFLVWATLELFALWSGWGRLVDLFDGGIVASAPAVGARFGKLLPGLIIVALALYSVLLRVRQGGEMATAFALLLMAFTFYLLIGAELFYVSDLFGNRMNTVFKVYYQSWLLFSIVSAYGLYYLFSQPLPSLAGWARRHAPRVELPMRWLTPALRYAWIGVVVVLLLGSLYYPVGAALDRSRHVGGENTFDGLAYLQTGNSGEYEAIQWLRDEATWGRIVEAVGGDDDDKDGDYDPKYGRISSSTGLPTILGWQGHEHQWRGSRSPFDGRKEQVAQIYQSRDQELVRRLLETYDIRYVYVGRRERSKYGNSHFQEFSSFLKPVFSPKGVVIYERLSEAEGGS